MPANTLDLSAVTDNLKVNINTDGSVSVADTTNPNNANNVSNTIVSSDSATSVDSIQNIIGGSGNNTFAFADGAVFGGTIDGGSGVTSGGNNTLDYSAYTTGVTVDLSQGTATGTNGISDFNTVIGGSGDDVLTAGSDGDTLIGNAGNNVLYLSLIHI